MNTEITKRTIPVLHGSIKSVPQVDNTLTREGFYADAKAVGDILRNEQRAVNFSYDSNGNGLKADTIQEALDELKSNADKLESDVAAKAPSDPPMAVGVEYLTAEKWMEKPVYTQLITLTWSKGAVHNIANFVGKTPHKYFGRIGTWVLPFFYQGKIDGDYSAIVTIHKNNDDLRISMFGGTSVNGTLELQIWYTKE